MMSGKGLCSVCNKAKGIFSCEGCAQRFCTTHLREHERTLHEQLEGIINAHDQLTQTINERQQHPQDSLMIEQIDEWERTAIDTIRRRAEKCREMVKKQMPVVRQHVEGNLKKITDQLTRVREENEFNELDLQRMDEQLDNLRRQLSEGSSETFAEDSSTLIRDIRMSFPTSQHESENKLQRWHRHAITVANRYCFGIGLDGLRSPWGIYVDRNEGLFIADCDNGRIVRLDSNTNSTTVVAGGGWGERPDQLSGPTDVLVDKHDHSIIIADYMMRRVVRWFDARHNTKPCILIDDIDCVGLAMDNEGFLYVSDLEKHEVRRWKDGQSTTVAGGNKRGSQLNQLDRPGYLFVDAEQSLFVSDNENHRVVKYRRGAREGMIVAGGNSEGDSLDQLSAPAGVFVDRWGGIYVADWGNARVVRWRKGEREGEFVVGGNAKWGRSDQLSYPAGLSMDDEGNLYVADCWNHEVRKFSLSV